MIFGVTEMFEMADCNERIMSNYLYELPNLLGFKQELVSFLRSF